jgi:hypothetical protein
MSITNLRAPSNPATGRISDVYTYFPRITSARAGHDASEDRKGADDHHPSHHHHRFHEPPGLCAIAHLPVLGFT